MKMFQSIISVRTGVDVPIATPHCQNATGFFSIAVLHKNSAGHAANLYSTLAADDTRALVQLREYRTNAAIGRTAGT
jgi:hypothetical protein